MRNSRKPKGEGVLDRLIVKGEFMRSKTWSGWNLQIGIWAILVSLLVGAAKAGPTLPRDCDGYTVTDTVKIGPNLHRILDTVPDQTLILLSVTFQIKDQIPDSCRQDTCPDFVHTNFFSLYQKWKQKMFTDYEFFAWGDTLHRLTPDEMGGGSGYTHIWARKSTILALSTECYVTELDWSWEVEPVDGVSPGNPFSNILPKTISEGIDALGRKPYPRNKSQAAKMPTPTFAPRH